MTPPNKAMPEGLNTGLTLIGGGAAVPENGDWSDRRSRLVTEKDFGKKKKVASGWMWVICEIK